MFKAPTIDRLGWKPITDRRSTPYCSEYQQRGKKTVDCSHCRQPLERHGAITKDGITACSAYCFAREKKRETT